MTGISHKIFHKIDGRKIQLLVSLGSGQVSVALVYKNNQEKPLILNTRTREVPFDHNPSPSELQNRVLSTLDVVLKDFVTELGGMYELNDLYDSHQTIHDVYVTLSPLWLDTEVIQHEQRFDTPTVVTQEVIKEIIEGYGTQGVIDASVVHATANKYYVSPQDIVGMETPEIDLQIKKTTLSGAMQDRIDSVISNHVSTERVEQTSYIPSQKVVIHTVAELFGVHDEYMVIHIDAEDSHMIAKDTDKGVQAESISYGLAELKRQFIKENIAPDFTHARDMLRAYFEYALEDSVTNKIDYTLSIESQVLANLAQGMLIKQVPLFVISNRISELFFTRYVVQEMEHATNAISIEESHFEDLYETMGQYVRPSVDTLATILFLNN